MTRFRWTAIFLALPLAACQTQAPPSAYDIVASTYRDGSGNRCEQYAYESGRSRYEMLRTVTGQFYAAANANRTAELAHERCLTGRLN